MCACKWAYAKMVYVIDKIYEHYSKIWDSRGIYLFIEMEKKWPSVWLTVLILTKSKLLLNSDQRLSHMPFMGSPLSMLILVSIYLYIVKNGKKFMEHRKPMEIQQIIIVYNIIQIIANSALFLIVSSLHDKIMN